MFKPMGSLKSLFKTRTLWIASLGYFVDLYDIVIFGAVRVDSLKSMGFQGADLIRYGTMLLNVQMIGMLAGGFYFGTLGDKQGRKQALFASIFIYSLCTFLNGYAHNITTYAVLRFLAGFGLAGELGAAITLVSETLPQKHRGLGSAFVTAIGFLGAVCSSFVARYVGWENAYRIGGILGFLLLISRTTIKESKMFLDSRNDFPTGSSIKVLFKSKSAFKTLLISVVAGIPIWYVAGILSYLSPELAKSFHVTGEVAAGSAIMFSYMGAILGDVACGLLSQKLKSRKKAVLIFMGAGSIVTLGHPLWSYGTSPESFYFGRFLIGFGSGYFAILVAWTAELVGTNLRATMSTVVTNLIRATIVPITFLFQALNPSLGLIASSVTVGCAAFFISLFAILKLPETFHRDLNYIEE